MKSKQSGLCPPARHVVDAEVEPRLQTCQVPAGDLGQVCLLIRKVGATVAPTCQGSREGPETPGTQCPLGWAQTEK